MNNWTKITAGPGGPPRQPCCDSTSLLYGRVRRTQKLKLTGTVTRVRWRNPHTSFFVDEKGEDGQITTGPWSWAPERLLMRTRGWTRDSLKIGDRVTIEGARDR
ncbi:MAG: hypothetical protein IPM70_14175 [Proteobacteria bacterium]|nr:hypothetical protein [Pseudomonadota bacterium]